MSITKKRAQRQIQYAKPSFDAVVVRLNDDETVNVKTIKNAVIYSIPFHTDDRRLRRLKQAVRISVVEGHRNKLCVSGKARTDLVLSEFLPKGGFKWGDGTKWGDGHQWI